MRYRILTNNHAGYRPQFKKHWWSRWQDIASEVAYSFAQAETWINGHRWINGQIWRVMADVRIKDEGQGG